MGKKPSVRPNTSDARQERSIVDMLIMPDASDFEFEPPRLSGELYRKSELLCTAARPRPTRGP